MITSTPDLPLTRNLTLLRADAYGSDVGSRPVLVRNSGTTRDRRKEFWGWARESCSLVFR